MMKIREILALAPVIPVLTVDKLEHAAPLAQALYAGGLKVLEITLRTAGGAAGHRGHARGRARGHVGAGTLVRPQDFARAAGAGAQFAVTPGLTPQLAEAAAQVDYPLLPGIVTPGEILQALHFGYDTLKFFPAQPAGGIPMLQAFAGPFRPGGLLPHRRHLPRQRLGLPEAVQCAVRGRLLGGAQGAGGDRAIGRASRPWPAMPPALRPVTHLP